jgi:hypothetical protein
MLYLKKNKKEVFIMKFTQRRTKTSIQILVEGEGRNRLASAVKELSGSYEFKMIEESFFAAAEFYLDLHLPAQERQQQVKEIIETIERHLRLS